MKKAPSSKMKKGSIPWKWLSIGFAALLVIAAAGFFLLHQPPAPAPPRAIAINKISVPPAAPVQDPAAANPALEADAAAQDPDALNAQVDQRNALAPDTDEEEDRSASAEFSDLLDEETSDAPAQDRTVAIGEQKLETSASAPIVSVAAAAAEPVAVAAENHPAPSVETKSVVRTLSPPVQTAPVNETPPIARVRPEPFTIQVGAFRNKANAEQLIERLQKSGYVPFVLEVNDGKGAIYAVRFGQFASRQEAAESLTLFKQKENLDGIVRRFGSL